MIIIYNIGIICCKKDERDVRKGKEKKRKKIKKGKEKRKKEKEAF